MKLDNREAVRAVKDRLNIADLVGRYVELRQAGARFMGCCPFHQEKTASFSVNAEEGFFYCFGCQASGDIFDFYSRINGLDFKEALEQLAEECGIVIERSFQPNSAAGKNFSAKNTQERSQKQAALAMHDLAKLHFVQNLQAQSGELARAYLEKRQLSPEIITSFGLGWSKSGWNNLNETLRKAGFNEADAVNCSLLAKSERGTYYDRFRERLMFPIRNLAGKVIAFGGRIIQNVEGQPKYINSSDSVIYKKGEHLYGLFESRRAISQEQSIILTEGYMDVISLHQFGIQNACGVLGTALTPEQVKRLGQLSSKLILVFDGDRAGRKAALRSAEMILIKGLFCSVVLMPDGEDVDSLLHKEGAKAFFALRDAAPEGIKFCLAVLRRDFAPKDQLEWASKFLAQITEPTLQSRYAGEIAAQFGVNELVLRENMLSEGRQALSNHNAINNNEANRQSGRPVQNNNGTSQNFSNAKQMAGGLKWNNVTGMGNNNAQKNTFNKGTKSSNNGFENWKGKRDTLPVPPPNMPSVESLVEQQLLRFVVRYPHHLVTLQDLGAEWFISHPFAKALWNKLVKFGQEYSAAEISAILTDKEKEFWIRCRVAESLPKDREEQELEDVCVTLKQSHRREHGKTCISALRQIDSDSGADIDLLKALQETLRRSNE